MQCWPGQSDSGLWSIYSLVWSGPRWPDLSSEWVLTQSFTDLNIYDITSTSLRSTGKKTSGSRTTGGPCCLWIFQSYFQLCCFIVIFFTNSVSLYYFLKKSVTVRLSFNSFFKFITIKFVDIFFFNSLIIPKGRHSLTLLLTQKIRLCFIFATVLILSLCLVLFSFCRRNFFCCVLLRTLWLVCRCLAANSVYHHKLNRARILGQPWEIVLFLQNSPTSKNKISLKIPSGSERRIWNVCCVLPVLSLTLVKWVWERSELCRVTEVNALVWLADPGGQRHRVNFNISQLIWFTLLKL